MPRHEITPEQEATEREKAHRGTRVRRLVYVLVVVAAWLAIGGVGGPTVGRLSEVQQNDNTAFLPRTAESTTVSQLSARFDPSTSLPYFVVVERAGGLTGADRAAVQGFVKGVPDLRFAVGGKALGPYLSQPPVAAIPSEDGKALLVPVELDAGKADEVLGDSSVLFEGAAALRASAKETLAPSGLNVYVTGPGGIFADFVTAFAGIDGILLVVALGVVLLILLIVYRSPILPFVVLFTAVFGLAAAALVDLPAGQERRDRPQRAEPGHPVDPGRRRRHRLRAAAGLPVPGGAARPRVEVGRDAASPGGPPSSRSRPAPPPSSSACSACCCPTWATPRGLGPVGAIGIAGAFVAALTFLPAVLLLLGRGSSGRSSRGWTTSTPRTPWAPAGSGAAWPAGRPPPPPYLGGHAAGAAGARRRSCPTFRAEGDHRRPTRSSPGRLGHRPGGARPALPRRLRQPRRDHHRPRARPTQVVAAADQATGRRPAAAVTSGRPGVPGRAAEGRRRRGPGPGDAARRPPTAAAAEDTVAPPADATWTRSAPTSWSAATPASRPRRPRHRQRARPAGDHPGDPAGDLRRAGAAAALARRAAAAGAGQRAVVRRDPGRVARWCSTTSSTSRAPTRRCRCIGFVFLVALGIDYSIFLMTRVREESITRATRPGVLVALAVTGGVITSAGVVLAATFAALAVLPILFLAQIAFIVAFGVLLDTLVVRSLLVPGAGLRPRRRGSGGPACSPGRRVGTSAPLTQSSRSTD